LSSWEWPSSADPTRSHRRNYETEIHSNSAIRLRRGKGFVVNDNEIGQSRISIVKMIMIREPHDIYNISPTNYASL